MTGGYAAAGSQVNAALKGSLQVEAPLFVRSSSLDALV